MIAILFALTVAALVVLGLERNHRRQLRLGSHLSGSNDVEDRDVPRVRCELHVEAAGRTAPTRDVPRARPRRGRPTGWLPVTAAGARR